MYINYSMSEYWLLYFLIFLLVLQIFSLIFVIQITALSYQNTSLIIQISSYFHIIFFAFLH